MKQILFLFTLAFAFNAIHAQTITNTNKTKVTKTKLETPSESKVIKPEPTEPKTPPPPPAPKAAPTVNKTPATTTTQEAVVYSLTAVRVKVKTGNDNKEFNSWVTVHLFQKTGTATNGSSLFYQGALNNEMKINSETEFGLERSSYDVDRTLNALQTSGVKLQIAYTPNFFLDAWKIESITLMLEFKDQHGNLHPTLGSKTIVFSNASGLVNKEYPLMICTTDATFTPLTANITIGAR